jgi:hypothetical protein
MIRLSSLKKRFPKSTERSKSRNTPGGEPLEKEGSLNATRLPIWKIIIKSRL